jgi:hypothetical protein
MDGRQRYKVIREVAEMAVANGNGTVFGGYVRDFIRHEHAAKKFYASHKKETYTDPSVSPDTLDRLVVPNDIDVHFESDADYRVFRTALRSNFYNVRVTRIENVYTSDCLVRHLKLRVNLELGANDVARCVFKGKSGLAKEVFMAELLRRISSSSISTEPFDIDVLISGQRDPPFTDLDFQCNGLVMNATGIGLCKWLKNGRTPTGIYRMLDTIITDIKSNRAVVETLKRSRWDKMAGKGWDIMGGGVEKVKKQGEICTLCLEDLQPDEVYKFSCCNASYHRPCMSKIISSGQTAIADTGRCPHCRQAIDLFSDEIGVFGGEDV